MKRKSQRLKKVETSKKSKLKKPKSNKFQVFKAAGNIKSAAAEKIPVNK